MAFQLGFPSTLSVQATSPPSPSPLSSATILLDNCMTRAFLEPLPKLGIMVDERSNMEYKDLHSYMGRSTLSCTLKPPAVGLRVSVAYCFIALDALEFNHELNDLMFQTERLLEGLLTTSHPVMNAFREPIRMLATGSHP